MIRILLLLLPLLGIYLAIRWLQTAAADEIRDRAKKFGWIAAIGILLLLAMTGKLSVLFAMLGVALAFVGRFIPVIVRYAPQLHRLWQQFGNAKKQRSHSPPQPRSDMSKTQALNVLGLKPGANEKEIIDAHRKLISKLHPDRGGSDYLAAQINLAKKVLLAR